MLTFNEVDSSSEVVSGRRRSGGNARLLEGVIARLVQIRGTHHHCVSPGIGNDLGQAGTPSVAVCRFDFSNHSPGRPKSRIQGVKPVAATLRTLLSPGVP